jgi:iron complex transport system permease protein
VRPEFGTEGSNTISLLTSQEIKKQDARSRRLFIALTVTAVLATLASVFAATLFGRINIPASEVWDAIMIGLGIVHDPGMDASRQVVVFSIRLSRICLAALVGLSLAVAGTAFQGILRNPLADPFTIGVSAGAAFGASVAIFFGMGGATFFGLGLLPIASLAGALVALFAVLTLARTNGQLSPGTMVLAGIVVATFLSALISLVKSLDEESVSSIVFWVMGSLQGRGWTHVAFAFPYVVVGLLIIGRYSRELDLLSLGGVQLGVDVDRIRLRILVGASLLTAAAVSVSGVIGFVGLVVPHLIRMLIGAEHRRLLLLAGLLGSIALIWSDLVARVLLPGGEELPVGVVTALIGGPFFCALLKSKKEVMSLD